jgi:flavin reductase ActVB
VITSSEYRDAMARVASGVAIVTTSDSEGRWWGFTASSFTPLSIEPPLILVCLARDAGCHPVFTSVPAFQVNLIGPEHERLAARFGSKGVDKFAGLESAFRTGRKGLPVLDDALASLHCRTVEMPQGGDHTILIASVEEVRLRAGGMPAVHADRRFWDLVPATTWPT